MKISFDNPPHQIRERCEKQFDLKNVLPVFTFGDTIYNPHIGTIDASLAEHEKTHTEQQGDDPKGWWDDYLLVPKFRLRVELEAYQKQYQFLKKNVKDRNQLAQYLHFIASDLSGAMYGGLISFNEAKTRIMQ